MTALFWFIAIIVALYLFNLFLKKKETKISQNPEKILRLLEDSNSEEVYLGNTSARKFIIRRDDFTKFCFIIGATGSGKTVTIKRIFKSFVSAGYPVIYVDGKPSDRLVSEIKSVCNEKFKGFNCDDFLHYDFLIGTPTEITDKIMCLKERWESDYYKGLAKNILQIVIKFLQQEKKEVSMRNIVAHLNLSFLENEMRKEKSELIKELALFMNLKKAELMGLHSHLLYFVNSDFGKYFDKDNKSFTLEEIIENKECAYFAIPALQYPEFAASVGKIVVNDIKNTIFRVRKKVLIILDEYSVFAGEQSLNLINQGREFGSHLIVAMQSFTDLPFPPDSLLTNANMLIAHRVNSDDAAEKISGYFGTNRSVQITSRISSGDENFVGSMRNTREFKVHPDDVKTLPQGEVYIAIKDRNIIEKVKIING